MAEQTEKAFQQQDAVFAGTKRVLGRKNKGGQLRYWKNIGLGFKTPREAIEGTPPPAAPVVLAFLFQNEARTAREACGVDPWSVCSCACPTLAVSRRGLEVGW